MSRMRFEAGEQARFVVPVTTGGVAFIGNIVEVVSVGPFQASAVYFWNDRIIKVAEDCDYAVLFPGEDLPSSADDFQLQKLNPPVEPDAITRREEVEA